VRTIAIFGAGPALGMSVARRFGREGYRTALVARSRERLDGMVRELAGEGVEAAGFPADLTDQAAAVRAVDQIEARFGPIEVVEYGPTASTPLTGAAELDVATIGPLLGLYPLTPIALAGRVLPGMRERGRGGLLLSMGAAARHPVQRWAAPGIVQAAALSYVHTLNPALAGTGVYAGALLIGAIIENSDFHRQVAGRAGGQPSAPVVSPDDLAGLLWDMYQKQDRVEELVTDAH
jgi:short-subunit dehydrogenase